MYNSLSRLQLNFRVSEVICKRLFCYPEEDEVMNNGIENILAVLNPDNTMSINRPLAHAIGMNDAV